MRTRARLRAHWGLWALVAVLTAATGVVSAGTAPMSSQEADRALRRMVDDAPSYLDRDLVLRQRLLTTPVPLSELDGLQTELTPHLRDVIDVTWPFQRTTVALSDGVGARLVGQGVTTAPDGLPPVISFHTIGGLTDEVVMVDGEPPHTRPGSGVVDVMVAADVASVLQVEAGAEYTAVTEGLDSREIPVRVTGVFQPRDPLAPVWDLDPLLLSTATIPVGAPPTPPLAVRAALVTDEQGFAALASPQLIGALEPQHGVRIRLDAERVDKAWADAAPAAVAEAYTDPDLRDWELVTRLPELLDTYARQTVSMHAVLAVVAGGAATLLVGLLVLTVRLVAERRRHELTLLRARGASPARVAGWLIRESAAVAVPAAAAGVVATRLLFPDHSPGLLSPAGAGPLLATTATAMLVVPVAGIVASGTRRRRLPRVVATVLRAAAELSVLLLAVLGVVLLHQRGLTAAGVDPYLAAVPVLLAVAAGLLALRLYRPPVRLLAAAAVRARAPVAFLALARAGRAAPATTTGLLVLVAAVSLAGFANAVNAGLDRARDASAMAAVGADLRLAATGLPEAAVHTTAQQPGATAVAAAGRSGVLVDLDRRSRIRQVTVVAVDAVSYQRVLDEIGADYRLPLRIVAATPGQRPVPILAAPHISDRGNVAVQIGDDQYPVTVVGDVAGIPGPDAPHRWALVPRQALPDPGPVDELIIAGTNLDPDAILEALAGHTGPGQPAVTSLTQVRRALEDTGYHSGLTLLFTAGAGAAGAAGVLAMAVAVVVPARSRGRELSLLRTMGLSHRQAPWLLLTELLPASLLAVATGIAVGTSLPLLLGPALGLNEFTGGTPFRVVADPGLAGTAALLALAVAAAGVAAQAVTNRRHHLGGVLRVG